MKITPTLPRARKKRNDADDELVEVRTFVPRRELVQVAPPPDLVSQRTSLAVLAIDRRPFLESLVAFRSAGGEVIELGKLRLVKRERYLEWLSIRSADSKASDPESDGAVAFLGELGLRVVNGGRR